MSSRVTAAHGVAVLGHLALQRGDQPADRHHRPVRAAVVRHERGDRAVRGRGQDVLEPRQRVVGHVEPEHLALEREPLLLVPVRQVRDVHGERQATGAVAVGRTGEVAITTPSASSVSVCSPKRIVKA